MPIAVRCRGCDKQYRVKVESAGKTFRCPQCRELVAVPDARSSNSEGSDFNGDHVDDDDDFRKMQSLTEPRSGTEPQSRSRKRTNRGDNGKIGLWIGIGGGIAAAFTALAIGASFLFPLLGVVIGVGLFLCAILVGVAGIALNFVGGIGCLVKAFAEDVSYGLLYLFVPCYGLYYIITRGDRLEPFRRLFFISFAAVPVCLLLMVGGGTISWLSGSNWYEMATKSKSKNGRTKRVAVQPNAGVLPLQQQQLLPRGAAPQNFQQFPPGAFPPNMPANVPPGFPPEFARRFPQGPGPMPQPGFNQPPSRIGPDGRERVFLSEKLAQKKTMPVPAGHEFFVGDIVYLQRNNKLWYECEVLEVNAQGHPKVHWIGRDDKYDEFATPDRIRISKT